MFQARRFITIWLLGGGRNTKRSLRTRSHCQFHISRNFKQVSAAWIRKPAFSKTHFQLTYLKLIKNNIPSEPCPSPTLHGQVTDGSMCCLQKEAFRLILRKCNWLKLRMSRRLGFHGIGKEDSRTGYGNIPRQIVSRESVFQLLRPKFLPYVASCAS